MASPRRFPAVALPNGDVAIFDPWIEGARTWGASPSRAFLGRVAPSTSAAHDDRETRAPLTGEVIEFVVVAQGEGIHDLPHVVVAPLCRPGVFGRRPDVAQSLAAGGPAIRAAVIEALIGGAKADDGTVRATIGGSEILVDPITAHWSIENSDGHRRSGDTLRHFGHALGAVPDDVLAVRLLETVFACRISAILARTISDALDRWHPILEEAQP